GGRAGRGPRPPAADRRRSPRCPSGRRARGAGGGRGAPGRLGDHGPGGPDGLDGSRGGPVRRVDWGLDRPGALPPLAGPGCGGTGVTTAADRAQLLEERIGEHFAAHGYLVRRRVQAEGRSGGRHEIDVLAEKSDPLTTFRLAVECKAWGSPIEKDVVSKLS